MAEDTDQEDKTEEPTERRIERSIEKGEVPKSMELATFFSLGAGTLALLIAGAVGMKDFVAGMRGFLGNAHQVQIDPRGLTAIAEFSAWKFFSVMAVPFLFAVAAGVAAGLMMHRPIFTTETMMPKLSRLSPMAGFKRMFGKEALVQFVKSLVKITLVGAVIIWVLWPERGLLDKLVRLDPIRMMDVSWMLTFKLLTAVLCIFFFVALFDVLYQRHAWHAKLRMTREELKQEFKESEGSPEIKAKIRKLRAEMLKKRMMAAVPKASVILTNPTHYAVALKYEAGMNAPVLVAKGVDTIALKIREVAGEHDVPIVENPPLARALHANVEIDAEIPEEHYKAVAEVIGYVMRLRRSAF